jgi:hypothetical protein
MSTTSELLAELEATGREYLIASLDHTQKIDDATQDSERARYEGKPENHEIQKAWRNALMRIGAAQVGFTNCLNRARAALAGSGE